MAQVKEEGIHEWILVVASCLEDHKKLFHVLLCFFSLLLFHLSHITFLLMPSWSFVQKCWCYFGAILIETKIKHFLLTVSIGSFIYEVTQIWDSSDPTHLCQTSLYMSPNMSRKFQVNEPKDIFLKVGGGKCAGHNLINVQTGT